MSLKCSSNFQGIYSVSSFSDKSEKWVTHSKISEFVLSVLTGILYESSDLMGSMSQGMSTSSIYSLLLNFTKVRNPLL